MPGTVTRWIDANVQPLDDVRPVAAGLGGATVVALVASARSTHELSVVAGRFVRVLVAEHGFRGLVLEGDEAASAELDAYLRTGVGDPAELLRRARVFWRTREILDLVRWLRAWNERHPDDPVRAVHPAGRRWGRTCRSRRCWRRGCSRGTRGPVSGSSTGAGSRTRPRAGAAATRTWGRGCVRGSDGPALVWVVGPRYDPAVRLDGGTLAQWFDVLVHVRRATPVHMLPGAGRWP